MTGTKTTSEQRSVKRKRLIEDFGVSFSSYYIDVFNDQTGELMGKLEDISRKGMRLFSDRKIPTNCTYSVRITIPGDDSERKILFRARSIWCNHERGSAFYHTGFSFTKISDRDSEVLSDPLAQS